MRAGAVASAALLAGLACTHALWLSRDRLYPQVPVAVAYPFAVNAVLVGLLVTVLAVATIPRSPPWVCALAVALGAVLVAGDQSRLQPWVLTYGMLLLCASFATRDPRRNAAILQTMRIVVVAQYFWSGVQKANVTFVQQVWPSMVDPLFRAIHLPAPIGTALGWAAPAIEIALALALLLPRTRRAGVLAACAMHVLILGSLVVSGENVAVWPWNVAMPVLDWLLFWPRAQVSPRGGSVRAFPVGVAIVVLVAVLPVLSLFGRWDAYASSALYSGNTVQGVVTVDPAELDALPPPIRRSTWTASRPNFIDINRWSYDELQVPVYPEPRIYRWIGRFVCGNYGRAARTLVLLGRPDWRTGRREQSRFPCADATW